MYFRLELIVLDQFALAHWMFWDAAILSSHAKPPPDAPFDTVPVHVTFLDWISGICSTLGLLVVNLINKEHLLSDGGYHQDASIVWRARLFLFVGFALMAGGLAGSVVRNLYALNLFYLIWSSQLSEYPSAEIYPQ
jgi:hypothetical protein